MTILFVLIEAKCTLIAHNIQTSVKSEANNADNATMECSAGKSGAL